MPAQFLIATSQLKQPALHRSIIFLCEHQHDAGALGVVINKQLDDVPLSKVFNQMGIQANTADRDTVLHGGPTHAERGLIVYRDQSAPGTNTEVGISYSKTLLQDIAEGNGPNDFFLALGHTNWQAGQLQSELQDNQWLLCHTSSERIRDELLFFAPISERYRLACQLLGFQPQQLSWQLGHA